MRPSLFAVLNSSDPASYGGMCQALPALTTRFSSVLQPEKQKQTPLGRLPKAAESGLSRSYPLLLSLLLQEKYSEKDSIEPPLIPTLIPS
jgi:hypothetical protein